MADLPLQDWSCLTDVISFCDEMTGFVNEGRAVHVISLNLQKVFNTLPNYSCIQVQMLLSGWADKSRLDSESQRRGVDGSYFTCRPEAAAGVQGTGTWPGLLLCQWPDRSDGAHIRCAGDTKLEVNTVTRTRLTAAGWRNVVTETLWNSESTSGMCCTCD